MSAGANSDRLRVVAVVGSPRADGNTSVPVDILLEEIARHAMKCRKLLLGEHTILHCAAHDDCATLPVCPPAR